MKFSTHLQENMAYFNEKLDVASNFDVVYRVAKVGGRDAQTPEAGGGKAAART